MKANEFRVTNLVLNDGIANAIIMIGYDSVELVTPQGNTITARLDLIQPIPITEEWLLRFGFSDKEYKIGYIGIDIKYETTITDFVLTKPAVLGVWQENYTWEHVKYRFTELQYIHQLQNLYFSLTGQELTIR